MSGSRFSNNMKMHCPNDEGISNLEARRLKQKWSSKACTLYLPLRTPATGSRRCQGATCVRLRLVFPSRAPAKQRGEVERIWLPDQSGQTAKDKWECSHENSALLRGYLLSSVSVSPLLRPSFRPFTVPLERLAFARFASPCNVRAMFRLNRAMEGR